MANPAMTYAVFAPVVLFVLYRKFSRHFGRQPLSATRLWMRLAVLAIVLAALLLIGVTGALAGGKTGLAVIAGLAGGGMLGVVGLRRTRFESVAGARSYTPDPWIGVALSALMVGRLVYRFVMVRATADMVATGGDALGMLHRSPLTLGIAGLLVGYYTSYCLGLLRVARAPVLAGA